MSRKKQAISLDDYEWWNEEGVMTIGQAMDICSRFSLSVDLISGKAAPGVLNGWWVGTQYVGDIEGVIEAAYRLLEIEECDSDPDANE